MNNLIKITEDRPDGNTLEGIVSNKLLAEIEANQTLGGFRRYSIDIIDETKDKPTIKDLDTVLLAIIPPAENPTIKC